MDHARQERKDNPEVRSQSPRREVETELWRQMGEVGEAMTLMEATVPGLRKDE